jgi:hypothetical protein
MHEALCLMNNFYQSIPSFSDFRKISQSEVYHPVPEDWSVIITDIKGSTQAISAGKYKDVNTIGAASIVVARKAMEKIDFPFVFGGDGATLLIPSSKVTSVCNELSALKRLAKSNFELDLRVGIVRIRELYDLGEAIEIAKYELAPSRFVAMINGNGMNQAEYLIKSNREKYEVVDNTELKADLTGLSCRWKPIPSKNGKIISLIISSRNGPATYQYILKEMDKLFPKGIEEHNPVKSDLGSYKSIFQCIKEELRYHSSIFSIPLLLRMLEIIPAVIIFKYKINFPFIVKYTKSMQTHSDYRKFDNALRMVMDCTEVQIKSLKLILEDLHSQGAIFYGTSLSDHSLMTCYVDSLNEGQHIHFIDAENGGYAMAAVDLKKQMSLAKA